MYIVSIVIVVGCCLCLGLVYFILYVFPAPSCGDWPPGGLPAQQAASSGVGRWGVDKCVAWSVAVDGG